MLNSHRLYRARDLNIRRSLGSIVAFATLLAIILCAPGTPTAAPVEKPVRPRIYIATDLEGVGGIYRWQQTRETQATNPEFQEARKLLMAEIDAVIGGCLAAGAGEIVVRDGHDGGHNAVPELMNPAAQYICGFHPGLDPRIGLDSGFNAVILLGYHAMAGTADGVLNHTKSSASGRRYFLGDREIGEIAMDALTAGHYGIPVIMVTGDDAVCRESHDFLGRDVITVCTKTGYATEYAKLIPPVLVRPALRAAAEKAVRNITSFKPYKWQTPVRGRLAFPSRQFADEYKVKSPSTRRVDDLTFERVFTDLKNVAEF